MRKIAIILVLSLFICSAAYAHPPSDIKLTYVPKTKILTAIIMHNVKDVKKHFIYKVDVSINGKEVISHAISQQDNLMTQTVSYLLPDAKPGDALSVEAYCNLSGKLLREIKTQK